MTDEKKILAAVKSASREKLEKLALQIFVILYVVQEDDGDAVITPDKEWDSEAIDEVAHLMIDAGLGPAQVIAAKPDVKPVLVRDPAFPDVCPHCFESAAVSS